MVTGHPKKLFSRGHPQALINSTNIPPIMIINRIYETQNLLSLQLVSFLVGLRTYQHPCKSDPHSIQIMTAELKRFPVLITPSSNVMLGKF